MDFDGPLADAVASAAVAAYKRLGKKGKCGEKEWTVLAAFVAVHPSEQLQVLSLATGTKCLPSEARCDTMLSDSHAEVLARRALCVRLLERGPKAAPLWQDDGTWNPAVRLFLYTSREPCGSRRDDDDGGERVGPDAAPADAKRARIENARVGAVRKPGRGRPSDCVSCADKLSRWVALGLLSRRCAAAASPPLCGLVVGGPLFEGRAALAELLAARGCPLPLAAASGVRFPCDERDGAHPSGLAINWIDTDGVDGAEVTQPNGRRMGANSNGPVSPKHISRLAPVHRVVADDGYAARKAAWQDRVGF